MKLWLVILACSFAPAIAEAVENTASRFSQVVPTADRAALGLPRLSSDQLGALDALVRRDTVARSRVQAETPLPAAFSQRLSDDERRLAGLTLLTPEELVRLDAAVERHASATLARALLAPPVYVSRARARADDPEKKPQAEIHGSFTLSYGWGKGGYSEKSGAMVVSIEDPSRRFALTVGYAETHVKRDDGRYVEALPPRP